MAFPPRVCFVATLICVTAANGFAAWPVLQGSKGPSRPITIYRDKWGVPTISADGMADSMYALGYLHASDDAQLMAFNYKLARGRTAEVNGRSQLLIDGVLRSLGLEDYAIAAVLTPQQASVVDSYVSGANRALAEHRSELPDWIKPFSRIDVLSFIQFVNCAFPLLDLSQQLMPGTGSNQFAVGPTRTSTGHPIVSIDPHLSWNGADGGIVWYEAGISLPGLNFRGISLPGAPGMVMGHNDFVGWSVTNNDPQLYVRYTVKTNPNNRSQYSYFGQWRDFKTKHMMLDYIDAGQLKTVTQTVRMTEWGPMLPLHNQAVYFSPAGHFEMLDQGAQMMQARSAHQFRDSLQPHGLSMWNFVFADTKGNIGYQYNARVEKRDATIDWSKPVAGDDPRAKLGELWTNDELPHIMNPRSGLLVNCNTAPWLTPVGPGIRKDWPKYVTDYGLDTRYQMLSTLLTGDPKLNPAKARLYATDNHVPNYAAAIKALESAGATGEPIRILKRWDGQANIDSEGTALFAYWILQSPANGLFAKNPLAASLADARVCVASLADAANALIKDHGRLTAKWGEVLRMRRGTKEIGVSGFGYFAPNTPVAVSPTGPDGANHSLKDGKIIASRGSSFRMIISLEPGHVRSWSILPYGNSQDPKNPHFADQMDLFATRRYKETSFGLEAARRSAVQTIQLK